MIDWVKKLTGELIDIVQWLDDTNNTLVYRFERYNNEIKYGAKLVVREGQMAVFINEGQLADVFKPGTHTLTTQNLPILSTLKGWKYGFESPFKAKVYFVSTRKFTDLKWGTPGPATMRDKDFGVVRGERGRVRPATPHWLARRRHGASGSSRVTGSAAMPSLPQISVTAVSKK